MSDPPRDTPETPDGGRGTGRLVLGILYLGILAWAAWAWFGP